MKRFLCTLLGFLAVAVLPAADLTDLFPPPVRGAYAADLSIDLFIPADADGDEIAAAASAVNRLGQERLTVPAQFYRTTPGTAELTILPRTRLRRGDPLTPAVQTLLDGLAPGQGLVCHYLYQGRRHLLVYGPGRAAWRSAEAFFAHYPCAADLLVPVSLAAVRGELQRVAGAEFRLDALVYSFIDRAGLAERRLDRFRFPEYTVERLVAVHDGPAPQARKKLEELARQRSSGRERGVLSFADIRRLEVRCGDGTVVVPRSGATAAELTPPYKPFQKNPAKTYPGRLEELWSLNGMLADRNGDALPDAPKAPLICAPAELNPDLITLCGLVSSHLAGTMFPLLTADGDVEQIAQLDFPVLFGRQNRFVQQLLKKGRLRREEVDGSLIRIVEKAFGDYPALVITDRVALQALIARFRSLGEFDWGRDTLRQSLQRLQDTFTSAGGGDVLFFLSRIKGGQAAGGGLLGDYLDDAAGKALLPAGEWGWAGADRLVREWRWPLPGEVARVREMLEKEVLGKIPAAQLRQLRIRASESPAARQAMAAELGAWLKRQGYGETALQVDSAYKTAYFHILERFLPRLEGQAVTALTVRAPLFREEERPRRFYQDEARWLQELYPIDEAAAGRCGLTREAVSVELAEDLREEYEIRAQLADGRTVTERLRLHPYRRPYLQPLPQWGEVTVNGGGIEAVTAAGEVRFLPFRTDPEVFWDLYQQEVLPFLYDHIQKKTAGKPKLDNQPFFKQLKIDITASEPDFRSGIDQEMVSSLEALHDEIYFDTLDLLAGMLQIEPGDNEFNMRKSSPGNVLPLIHPSREGQPGEIVVTLTDYAAPRPRLNLQGGEPLVFPELKKLACRLDALAADGATLQGRFTVEAENEGDFDAAAAILESLESEAPRGRFPYGETLLQGLQIELLCKQSKRTFTLRLPAPIGPAAPGGPPAVSAVPVVPAAILAPAAVQELAAAFGRLPGFTAFTAGRSFEKRPLPALFVHRPENGPVSLVKLLVDRPTLFLSARQHANEVSSTTYLLQTLAALAADPAWRPYLDRFNIAALPLENPDGSALTYELQKSTPYHSLHAGRYTAKGVDVGYVLDDAVPAVPEARVRPLLLKTFQPDLHLNLHGYPSHEWVQPFSGYSPFLFRNYWIPKGMFAYFTYVNSVEKEGFRRQGRELLNFLGRGLADLPGNDRFTRRYRYWSERWAPHLNELDEVEGSVLFHTRENAGYKKYPENPQTLAVEVPELMDETAQGPWLEELLAQGRRYLKLHFDFFAARTSRHLLEHYEAGDRVYITRKRLRPEETPER